MSSSSQGSTAEPSRAEIERRVAEAWDVVPMLARQMRRRLGTSLEVDELESAGREALFAAARSFDASRGVPFRRWANLRARGAMIDSARSHGGLPKRVYRQLRAQEAADHYQDAIQEEDSARPPPANASEADARIEQTLSGMALAMAAGFLSPLTEGLENVGSDDDSPEALVSSRQLIDRIREALEERPDAERTLIVRHYFEGSTFEQAAKELGLSKSWASRLHARAIDAIAKRLRDAPGRR